MTPEEVLEQLDELIDEAWHVEALECAKAAYKKEIPTRPVQPHRLIRYGHPNEYHDYGCPNCKVKVATEPEGNGLIQEGKFTRCWMCGQLIDWHQPDPKEGG